MKRVLFPALAAAALAVTLAFFFRLAFTDRILARGDTFYYFYPLWAARDAALAQGQLPLWTPDVFMGAPLLSDPQLGTFYPPNWLTVALAPPNAVRVSILLHVAWSVLGMLLLARRWLHGLAAFAAAVIFAFGGYVGAHVEQINQLQGIAWMPWAFLAYAAALQSPRRIPLLAAALALQVLSGHTQTVFITGVGLGIYGLGWLWTARGRRGALVTMLGALGAAVGLAALLALPQLIPTLELTGLSNRGGGLNPQQAMAFSWNPLLAGRGILPSYDAQVFGEYVGYVGVIGLALAALGISRRSFIWLVLALAGLVLAFGLYTPVYWLLADLPGFNLFRVPARWLALFTVGAALLAGFGVQRLVERPPRPWQIAATAGFVAFIAFSTRFADRAASEVNGPALPTAATLFGWAAAGGALLALLAVRRWIPAHRYALLLLLALALELFAASQAMPYNDLADPAAYDDARFTVYQLRALYENDPASTPPGRLLSISNLYFDPGDRAGLTARYAALGMTDRATHSAFTAAKLKEVVAPNLPLVWGIPSVDGLGGGVLPTGYYTAFTSLLLPENTPRSIDGRLREVLAQEGCLGACVPDARWLALTNTRYLITDKTFDLVQDGIFYDTTFAQPLAARDRLPLLWLSPPFSGDMLAVLYTGASAPTLLIDGETHPFEAAGSLDRMQIGMARFTPHVPGAVALQAAATPITFHAISLVDSRTGTFTHITPWRRVLSSDIKLYENPFTLPRAFVVTDAVGVPDTWDGTETALRLLRDLDPAQTAVIARAGYTLEDGGGAPRPNAHTAAFTAYEANRVALRVQSERPGLLLLSDAYYPGWRAQVNGSDAEIYRADVMFRAVEIPAGESTVVFTFAPGWLPGVLVVGVLAWLALAGYALALRGARTRQP